MKIILIIQTLIIIAGAYYIYTLREPTTSQTVLPVADFSDKDSQGTATVDTSLTTETAEATTNIPATTPNDAGMEWPTLESDSNLQVQ